jgi:hypothetical protein
MESNAHRPGRGGAPHPSGVIAGADLATTGGGWAGTGTGSMGSVRPSIERRAMEHLYGTLDGGGVISVAMRGDID